MSKEDNKNIFLDAVYYDISVTSHPEEVRYFCHYCYNQEKPHIYQKDNFLALVEPVAKCDDKKFRKYQASIYYPVDFPNFSEYLTRAVHERFGKSTFLFEEHITENSINPLYLQISFCDFEDKKTCDNIAAEIKNIRNLGSNSENFNFEGKDILFHNFDDNFKLFISPEDILKRWIIDNISKFKDPENTEVFFYQDKFCVVHPGNRPGENDLLFHACKPEERARLCTCLRECSSCNNIKIWDFEKDYEFCEISHVEPNERSQWRRDSLTPRCKYCGKQFKENETKQRRFCLGLCRSRFRRFKKKLTQLYENDKITFHQYDFYRDCILHGSPVMELIELEIDNYERVFDTIEHFKPGIEILSDGYVTEKWYDEVEEKYYTKTHFSDNTAFYACHDMINLQISNFVSSTDEKPEFYMWMKIYKPIFRIRKNQDFVVDPEYDPNHKTLIDAEYCVGCHFLHGNCVKLEGKRSGSYFCSKTCYNNFYTKIKREYSELPEEKRDIVSLTEYKEKIILKEIRSSLL